MKDRKRDNASWAASFFAVMVVLFFVWLEVVLLQWLLGLFGFHFSWWTAFGILLVVDLLLGNFKTSGK